MYLADVIGSMKAYSMDLRERVFKTWQTGQWRPPELAERYDVSISWVCKLINQHRQEGHIKPKPRGGDTRSVFDKSARTRLVQKVHEQPDMTLQQLRRWAQEELGVVCSIMAVDRTLKKENLTYKKNA
jgi:transposase